MAFEELGDVKGRKLLNLFRRSKFDPIKYRALSLYAGHKCKYRLSVWSRLREKNLDLWVRLGCFS
jgi:hypothetical protein